MLQNPFAKRTQNQQLNNHQIKKRQKRPKKRLSQLGSSTMPHTHQISLKRPQTKKPPTFGQLFRHKHLTKLTMNKIRNTKVNQ